VALPSGGLWRHGDFLRLWGAQRISQIGSRGSVAASFCFLFLLAKPLRTMKELPELEEEPIEELLELPLEAQRAEV
jgi:hypothetical protein